MALNFVRESSIGAAMKYVAAVPLVGLLALSVWIVVPKVKEALVYSEISDATELATLMSSLVHEQQKERGATAVYLTTSGESYGAELREQRKVTETRRGLVVSDLSAYLERISGGEAHAEVARALEGVATELARLGEVRAQVDRLEISPAEAVAFYTGLNNRIIGAILQFGRLSDDSAVISSIDAFASFLSGKDLAGIERAIGSSAFSTGEFTLATLLRLKELISSQEAYYSFFLADAPVEAAQDFETIMNSEAAKNVQRMRDIAFDAGPGGDLQGVSGDSFFTAQTQKIDLLKDLEDAFARDLLTLLDKRTFAARVVVALSVLGLIAVIGLSLGMAILIARTIRSDMTDVTGAATAMAAGDLDVALPKSKGNELGQIAGALDQFRQSIITAQSREAEARAREKAEQERQRQAELAAQRAADEEAESERRQIEAQRAREQKIAQEIAAVVASCANGDFSQRLRTDDKDGVLAELCQGINDIGSATEEGLAGIAAVLDKLADGDLSGRVSNTHRGVFAKIAAQLNVTTEKLAAIVLQIISSSGTIDASSNEIADAMGDIARRTEQSAASLEETAAALEELSASVKSTADGAQTVQKAASDARSEAAESFEIAGETVEAMKGIEDSAKQISRIIDVIDDIAFQTNLLALNAGVEAARAGDAGRGFAVVASEVRGLAQRSSEAAREINAIVSGSQRQVEAGSASVNKSRDALERILTAINAVGERVNDIADATKQQSSGIAEINTAMSDLDRSTQQNAAMFEETTAASQAMRDEAQTLTGTVSHFKGGEGGKVVSLKQSRKQSELGTPHPTMQKAASAGAAATSDAWQQF
ncbi:methyl-accepting chemotaxis protein [Mesobaculum littorinae]|nr:nitrate- and nitrite sensing domain-containing protein [Mesobaculum littorinae]